MLLLDEPTRGIDVGAKFEIYKLILDLCNENKAVIVVSSELPELLGICDRILVMSNGRLAGIEDAKNLTQEKLWNLLENTYRRKKLKSENKSLAVKKDKKNLKPFY